MLIKNVLLIVLFALSVEGYANHFNVCKGLDNKYMDHTRGAPDPNSKHACEAKVQADLTADTCV